MSERRIEISPDLNVSRTLDRARTLAARAVKKGLSGGYTVRIEDGEPRPEMKQDLLGFFQPTGRMVTPRYLIIDGTPVAYNGWNFVATAEWVNNLPVVNGSPDYEGEQVDRDALVEGFCDHCQTVRRRNKVVIVENEAGERKAVGTSCVKDFLGAEVTPSWYAAKDTFEEFGGYTGGGRVDEVLEWTLTLAATVIRQAGFVPASAEN
jgi:ribosomal protein L36